MHGELETLVLPKSPILASLLHLANVSLKLYANNKCKGASQLRNTMAVRFWTEKKDAGWLWRRPTRNGYSGPAKSTSGSSPRPKSRSLARAITPLLTTYSGSLVLVCGVLIVGGIHHMQAILARTPGVFGFLSFAFVLLLLYCGSVLLRKYTALYYYRRCCSRWISLLLRTSICSTYTTQL